MMNGLLEEKFRAFLAVVQFCLCTFIGPIDCSTHLGCTRRFTKCITDSPLPVPWYVWTVTFASLKTVHFLLFSILLSPNPLTCKKKGAVYAHPIEFIFGNVAGVTIGPILCRVHPYTCYAWYAFALSTTCRHHSGYDFFDAQEHDAHHEFFHWNFGAYMDDMLGTKLPKDKEH